MKTASLLAGAFLALASTAALAQPGPGSPETRQFGDFQVRCFQVQGGSPCDMFEQVRNKETGQPLINFSIAFLPSNNRYVMVLGVPLGVALEKGVVIQTNSFQTPVMKFRRCDRAGCYVEAAVEKPLIDAFAKSSGEAKLRISADGEDKPREFPLSFNGFSAAHEAMVESNRSRSKPAAAAATP